MTNILFVCHGNICRSPMAEFLFRDMVSKQGLGSQFHIASAATSHEELGNPVHPGTRKKLAEFHISTVGKTASLLRQKDYAAYDYLIAMDQDNINNMLKLLGGDPDHKISLLLDFAGEHRNIADPWYTHNFEATYADVSLGCKALLAFLKGMGNKTP